MFNKIEDESDLKRFAEATTLKELSRGIKNMKLRNRSVKDREIAILQHSKYEFAAYLVKTAIGYVENTVGRQRRKAGWFYGILSWKNDKVKRSSGWKNSKIKGKSYNG